jgi:undecaprenyl-diphosphatase
MGDLTGVSDLLLAVLLGLVQGMTEFLPISSSAHLYALPYLFSIDHPLLSSRAFAAVVHLGTLAAVLVVLRSDVSRLLGTALRLVFSLGRRRGESADERLILAIVVGTVPAVAFGLLAGDFLQSSVRTPLVVAAAVLAGAALLWVADRASSLERPLSGIAAARISFLLGAPAIAGAGLLELRGLLADGVDLQGAAPLLAAGLIAAFISGLAAIRLLLRILSGGKLWSFALYRIVFALILLGTALTRGEI